MTPAVGLDRAQRVGTMLCCISLGLLLAMVVAPLTLPSGTVPPLGARANAIDYATLDGPLSYGNQRHLDHSTQQVVEPEEGFAWSDLPLAHALIYAFGDLNCHMLSERSWTVNGNQMPMCVRDLGILSGLALAGVVLRRRLVNRWTITDTSLSVLPTSWQDTIYARQKRRFAFFGLGTLCIVPLGLDGFVQLLTSYESTAWLRLVTGLPFGFGLGVLMGAMLSARPGELSSLASVSLPGGARFALREAE
jgi:uncharacterized membrane protein